MNKQTEIKLLNLVKKNYSEISEGYNETRKKYLNWEELIKYIRKIKTGQSVLDIGCGNGRLIEAFEGREIKYLGVDQSVELIKYAEELHPGYGFEKGDVLELGNIPEFGFDYVISIAVLHHIPGKKLRIKALKQLKNKINDKGEIMFTVWNMWSQKWDKKQFRKLIFKFFLLKFIKKNNMDFGDILFDWKNPQNERVSQRYYHAFTKRELKKIVKKAGLKVKKIFKDEYNYYCILTK